MVGSSLNTSSPTSAEAMAARMAPLGLGSAGWLLHIIGHSGISPGDGVTPQIHDGHDAAIILCRSQQLLKSINCTSSYLWSTQHTTKLIGFTDCKFLNLSSMSNVHTCKSLKIYFLATSSSYFVNNAHLMINICCLRVFYEDYSLCLLEACAHYYTYTYSWILFSSIKYISQLSFF